jgi:hypothetical protein
VLGSVGVRLEQRGDHVGGLAVAQCDVQGHVGVHVLDVAVQVEFASKYLKPVFHFIFKGWNQVLSS